MVQEYGNSERESKNNKQRRNKSHQRLSQFYFQKISDVAKTLYRHLGTGEKDSAGNQGYLDDALRLFIQYLHGMFPQDADLPYRDVEKVTFETLDLPTLEYLSTYIKVIVDNRMDEWRYCLYSFILFVNLKALQNRSERKSVCSEIFSNYGIDELESILSDDDIPNVVSSTIYESIDDLLLVQFLTRIYYLSQSQSRYKRYISTFFSAEFIESHSKLMSSVLNQYYNAHPNGENALIRWYEVNVINHPDPKSFVGELSTPMLMIFSSDPNIRSHYHPAYFIDRKKLFELVTLIEERYQKEEKDKESVTDYFYNSTKRNYRKRFFDESFLSEECYERYEDCLDEFESDQENVWDFLKGFGKGFIESIDIFAMWESVKSLKSFISSLVSGDFDFTAMWTNILSSLKGMFFPPSWYEFGKTLGGLVTSVIAIFISGPFVLIAKSLKVLKKVGSFLLSSGKNIVRGASNKISKFLKKNKHKGVSDEKGITNKEFEQQVRADAKSNLSSEEQLVQKDFKQIEKDGNRFYADKQLELDNLNKKIDLDRKRIQDLNNLEKQILKERRHAEKGSAIRKQLDLQLEELKVKRVETFDSFKSSKKEFYSKSSELDKEYKKFVKDKSDLKDDIGDREYIENLRYKNALRKAELRDEALFNPIKLRRDFMPETLSNVVGNFFSPLGTIGSLENKIRHGIYNGEWGFNQWKKKKLESDNRLVAQADYDELRNRIDAKSLKRNVTQEDYYELYKRVNAEIPSLEERIESLHKHESSTKPSESNSKDTGTENNDKINKKDSKPTKLRQLLDIPKNYILSSYDVFEKSLLSDFSSSRPGDLIYILLYDDRYDLIINTKSLYEYIINPDNVSTSADQYSVLLSFITSGVFTSRDEEGKKKDLLNFLKTRKYTLLTIFQSPTLEDTQDEIAKYLEAYEVNKNT